MIECDSAPMPAYVRDGWHPPKRCIPKRVTSFRESVVGWAGGSALGDIRT